MADFSHPRVTDPLYQLPEALHLVPDVPVPPFRTREEHTRFHRALAEYVAEVGRACGGQHLEDLLLAALVSEQVTPWRPLVSAYPTATVLQIALRLFFPAPWTPVGVVTTWNEVMTAQYPHWHLTRRDHIAYQYDPDFSARRDPDGRWTVMLIERGRPRTEAQLDNDGLMVLYLMQHLTAALPYPYAHAGTAADRMVPGARAAVAAWARQRQFPVYDHWNAR
ncbi:hypothetical protein [Cellulomonas sp. NPDC089187]|uniref:hypothetical protein n=1 Tax=Cellulomonas sp. NPDC089187 TaxID=3154970 RepID=UPI003439C144